MLVVAMVAAIVAVAVVVKVLVWDAATTNRAVIVKGVAIGVLADAEAIVVGVVVIVLKFSWIVVPNSVGVPSGLPIDLFINTLAGVMPGILTGIGVAILAGINANAFAVAMTALDFPFSPASAWPRAPLERDSVLQAWMPSYHV